MESVGGTFTVMKTRHHTDSAASYLQAHVTASNMPPTTSSCLQYEGLFGESDSGSYLYWLTSTTEARAPDTCKPTDYLKSRNVRWEPTCGAR